MNVFYFSEDEHCPNINLHGYRNTRKSHRYTLFMTVLILQNLNNF